MKTIRRILVTALISLSFSAANAFSEMNLRLFDNSNFNVTIDNTFYGNASSFCLPGLMPGNHYLVVTKPSYNYYPHHNGHGHGYGHGKKYYPAVITVFSGYVTIAPHSKMFAMIDPYNNFVVTGQQAICQVPVAPVVCYTQPDNCAPSYTPGMHLSVFIQLKDAIFAANFDRTKLAIAEQAIVANRISSNQLLDLMRMLSFESSKLELAKFAYSYAVDKQNYFVVNNAFDFNSSKNDLANFIGYL